MKKQKKGASLWSGRFGSEAASGLLRFTESVSFDQRLALHDIAGSIAHAQMLHRIKILKKSEFAAIVSGLKKIRREIEDGRFEWKLEHEDVHMNIEAALTARAPAGAKLHTGRSRNDQVATDMRLWLRDEIEKNRRALALLQKRLLDWAEKNREVIIPGYTHLQRAQPVSLAHHLLAYVEMLERDNERMGDCARRVNVLPLGAGAIAGSTLPLDRAYVARLLGFEKISANSMDAVSDRDFIIEYLAAAALLAVHLSRFAEDLILWSSAEFGFVRIGDAYTTGSSLMPQKKNPDIAELIRGKSARVIGNLVAGLTLLKGLPLTYNRDFQEDKERLFDTADTVAASLDILSEMIPTIAFNRAACEAAASDPLLLATDLADWLVKKGVPFRKAHHLIGQIVAIGEKSKRKITEIPLGEWKKFSPLFTPQIFKILSLKTALSARATIGSPHPSRVKKELERWQKVLKSRTNF